MFMLFDAMTILLRHLIMRHCCACAVLKYSQYFEKISKIDYVNSCYMLRYFKLVYTLSFLQSYNLTFSITL